MIASLDKKPFTFPTFNRKIDYHLNKIDKGVGELLYVSYGKNDVESFKNDAIFIAEINDRVQHQFNEVSLNLNKGAKMDNAMFLEIAQNYMKRLGYEDSAYMVVRHTDKAHEHLHVLFTTTDRYGNWISDTNIRRRSQLISRELEKEYNLKETEYQKFESKSLGEIKAREYYFYNSLVKGIKNYSTKSKIFEILGEDISSQILNLKSPISNIKVEMLLGESLYNRTGDFLLSNGLFRSLFKDELLNIVDKVYQNSSSFTEFKSGLENNGVYIRFITEKGKSKYIYGLPDVPFYLNDSSLPKKYRYENLLFQTTNIVENDVRTLQQFEQKHIIYNQSFIALNTSSNYNEFKKFLQDNNIQIIESVNKSGIYGLNFQLTNINNPISFKASEVSKKLTYKSIKAFFNQEQSLETSSLVAPIRQIVSNPIIIDEMFNSLQNHYPDFIDTNYRFEPDQQEDLLSSKKKTKKRTNRNREF